MAYDSNNIFAKILRQEVPTNRIYEDAYVIAFDDIHPKAPVHVLVVPKGAYVDFNDFMTKADQAEVNGVFQAVRKVAAQLGVVENGYKLLMNVGSGAGQEVPHLHIHILANQKVSA